MTDPKEEDDDASAHDSAERFIRDVARAPAKELELTPGLPTVSLVGARIDHFLVRTKLGEGGMGVVYEAEDEKLARIVALKVLPPVVDAESRNRFIREARAASRIVHPNVATVYEAGESASGAYISMEYVRGETMREWLRQPRSIAARVRVMREVASALAEAHAQGVVHRDLKPDNVMITPAGLAKVLDFGLAKQTSRGTPGLDETLTAEGRILGTPSYMSPEQAKGETVDARSDVFSFGVVMYEAFTGKRPFTGETAMGVLIAIDRDDPVPATKLAPKLPLAIARIIERALAKKPADRFADGSDLLRALDAIGPPAEMETRLPRFLSIRWVRVLLAVGVACEVTALVLFVRWNLARAPNAAPPVAPPALHAPGRAMTDFAPYGSKNEEAIEAYRRGLLSFRSAGTGVCAEFLRASQLDPAFAAAHLRRALCLVDSRDLAPARKDFREALTRRAELGERDRLLLDAFEPMVERNPADPHASAERLRAAVARFPEDAEIAYFRAVAGERDDPATAPPLYEKALELDPGFAIAWLQLAHCHYVAGRLEAGDVAIDRCLTLAPDSIQCITERSLIDVQRGACSAVELAARRMLTVAPRTLDPRELLASALAGEGRPVAAVRELIDQGYRQMSSADGGSPDLSRAFTLMLMQVDADVFEGDFETALGRLRAFEPFVAPLTDEGSHSGIAVNEVMLLVEAGRDVEGQAVARDFLARHDAWEPEPAVDLHAIAGDATVALAAYLRRAGVLSKHDAQAMRATNVVRWLGRVHTPEERGMVWVMDYAAASETPEEATEALATLPSFGKPPSIVPGFSLGAFLGHTYLLAGEIDEALPRLEQATRACDSIGQGWPHTRAYYDLGMAREAKGDTAAACTAYASLLVRWGNAKPRSVTAEKTRARMKALRCAK